MNSEANDSNVTQCGLRYKTRSYIEQTVICSPKTPSRKSTAMEPTTPLSAIRNLENGLTPRRSGRKSIKPMVDYNDIILNKSVLRSHELEMNQNQNKWSPSKVGRVSQKRSARKSRSVKKSKMGNSKETDSSDGSDEKNELGMPEDKNDKEIINTKLDGKNEDKEISHPKEGTIQEIISTTFDKESDGNDDKEISHPKEGNIEEKINTTFDKESDGKDEDKEISHPKEGTIQEIISTTFDKESDGNDDDKEISHPKEGNIEEKINTTFDKESDGKDEDKEISYPKEGTIQEIISTTFDKESDGNDEDKEIPHLKEGNIEKILNSTFEKEESLQNAELKEKRGNTLEEIEVVEMKSNQKTQSKKAKLNQTINNLIKEGNDLGCTPILYEDNTGAKQETKDGEKLEEEVFEEDPKNSNLQKLCVNTEKHNENEKLKLKLDESTVYEQIEVITDDEMSVLILSDDEEVDNAINDTFNTSDCIMISPSEDVQSGKKEMENLENSKPKTNEVEKKVQVLETNQPSVNKSSIVVAPKIMVTNDKNESRTLIPTPRIDKNRENIATPRSARKRQYINPTSATKGQRNITPISSRKCPIVGTPASTSKTTTKQSKGYRFPTPFKPKKDYRFGYQAKEDKENADYRFDSSQVPSNITTLEPKDIVLRSIRKRSLSITFDGDQRRRIALNVRFNSPANQTASTADLDALLALNAVKGDKNKTPQRDRILQRKRSMSVDENYLRNQPSKLPRPVLKSPLKPKRIAPVRKKVPNFAAIHQQQFQKMENIADYVARKAERAQNLTNSALKSRNAPSPAAKTQKPSSSRKLPLNKVNMDASNAIKKLGFTQNENCQLKVKKSNQRHMDMYKARTVASKSETRTTAEIIRGVRSNRRFDLMMQHRNLHSHI